MITEKKHTPGPWVLNQYGNIIDAKGDQVLASGLAMAAGYRPKHDVAFINARLIAAAPDLLEALEEVVEYHDGRGKYNFSKLPDEERANAAYDAWQDIWRKKIHPAIAKALGQ